MPRRSIVNREPLESYNINLATSLMDRVRRLAHVERSSSAAVIREALAFYLDHRDRQKADQPTAQAAT